MPANPDFTRTWKRDNSDDFPNTIGLDEAALNLCEHWLERRKVARQIRAEFAAQNPDVELPDPGMLLARLRREIERRLMLGEILETRHALIYGPWVRRYRVGIGLGLWTEREAEKRRAG